MESFCPIGLSHQKVNFFLKSIIGAFWEKNRLWGGGSLWHLLGSKSYLIIGQQSRTNAQLYRPVLRKNTIGGASLAFVALFDIKITLDYRPKKSKKCSIIRDTFWDQNYTWVSTNKLEEMFDIKTRFEKKIDFRGLGGSWAFVTPFGIKITLNYRSKKGSIL